MSAGFAIAEKAVVGVSRAGDTRQRSQLLENALRDLADVVSLVPCSYRIDPGGDEFFSRVTEVLCPQIVKRSSEQARPKQQCCGERNLNDDHSFFSGHAGTAAGGGAGTFL